MADAMVAESSFDGDPAIIEQSMFILVYQRPSTKVLARNLLQTILNVLVQIRLLAPS
jgi:hypothetical protein